jgi:hypothetical protein
MTSSWGITFPDGVMRGRGVWWAERGRIGGAGGGRDNDLRDVAGGRRIWPAGSWTASSTEKKKRLLVSGDRER